MNMISLGAIKTQRGGFSEGWFVPSHFTWCFPLSFPTQRAAWLTHPVTKKCCLRRPPGREEPAVSLIYRAVPAPHQAENRQAKVCDSDLSDDLN